MKSILYKLFKTFISKEFIIMLLTEWAEHSDNKLTVTRVSYIAEWLGCETKETKD